MSRALLIDGWMREDELEWLSSMATGKHLVVEVGSWRGRSTVALLGAERVVCVDNWAGTPGEPAHDKSRREHGEPWESFQENLAAELSSGQVVAWRGDLADEGFTSRLVSEYGGRADMVFLDGPHSEAETRRDMALAGRLLRDGGLECGHDYDWPGVRAAVGEGFGVGVGSLWARA